MFELPSTQFHQVLPLFNEDRPNSTMVFSTLEGRTPGAVYVNSIDNHTACLVTINFHHLTFLGGRVDQQWLNKAVDELRRTQDVNLAWSPQFANGLEPPSLPVAEIDRFEFYDCILDASWQLPEGHHLQTIDNKLLARCVWRNETLLAFGSAENFLRYGQGLCLMVNDEICCEAYAVFEGAGKIEIGVVTHDNHLKQGYAYMTCKHLIKQCEERGFPTYWSCHQDNAASVATARKLGYRTQKAYKFLHYPQIRSS